MKTKEIALISTLAALCIAIQLSPRPPNVELTSFFTFLVGSIFGSVLGAIFGAFVMFSNGFLSPYGFAGVIMPFQMVGMAIFGVVGGKVKPKKSVNGFLSLVALGSFLTLLYDIITNLGFALMFNLPIIIVLISGIVFTAIHVISNAIIFGIGFIPAIKSAERLLGQI